MFNAQDFAPRQDRWSLLKDFVTEWHRPLEDSNGYSAAELDAAEQRLGLKLPAALRVCVANGRLRYGYHAGPNPISPTRPQ